METDPVADGQKPESEDKSAPNPSKIRWPLWQKILLVVAVILGTSVATVSVFVIYGYQKEARPNRSSPDVVVDSYLRAALVDQNDTQAVLYSCSGEGDLSMVSNLRAEIDNREEEYKVQVRVSWGSLETAFTADDRSEVNLRVTIAGYADGKNVSRRFEDWKADVIKQGDEWRVCSIKKTS